MHIKFTIGQKNADVTISRESEVKTDTKYTVTELATTIGKKLTECHPEDGPITNLHVFVWEW